MNQKTNRFDVIYSQGTLETYRVIVDQTTGINYLYITNGASGGLTPLLDSTGNPIITNN